MTASETMISTYRNQRANRAIYVPRPYSAGQMMIGRAWDSFEDLSAIMPDGMAEAIEDARETRLAGW